MVGDSDVVPSERDERSVEYRQCADVPEDRVMGTDVVFVWVENV